MFWRWKKRALQAESINREFQAMVQMLSEHLTRYRQKEEAELEALRRHNALNEADDRLTNYLTAQFDLLCRELGDPDSASLALGDNALLMAANQLWSNLRRSGDIDGPDSDAFLAITEALVPRCELSDTIDEILGA